MIQKHKLILNFKDFKNNRNELKRNRINEKFEKFSKEIEFSGFEIGRIITEHKERYIVITKEGEFDAEITGNMRFTAKGR
jgi:hypothetical protein